MGKREIDPRISRCGKQTPYHTVISIFNIDTETAFRSGRTEREVGGRGGEAARQGNSYGYNEYVGHVHVMFTYFLHVCVCVCVCACVCACVCVREREGRPRFLNTDVDSQCQ